MVKKVQQFIQSVERFSDFGSPSVRSEFNYLNLTIPVYTNEFWTSKQRDAHSLHEVSYRACFKPQLPRFFIERLTESGDLVFDPFMGRGTTLLEAGLLNRRYGGCDINPLSLSIIPPRFHCPTIEAIKERLDQINLIWRGAIEEELLVFFHPQTLAEIHALRNYFLVKRDSMDWIDKWIRMVACNRLTGHSPGFFSVYSMPPNQAVSVKSQKRINARRGQIPEYRPIKTRIMKKSVSLLKDENSADLKKLTSLFDEKSIINASSEHLVGISDDSVSLIVTSPPFLDVVDYNQDNWLRCWFVGVNASEVPIWKIKDIEDWENAMERVLIELRRVLKKGGVVAFEVGEVRHGKVKLEEHVVKAAVRAGLEPIMIMFNVQSFTKTAACWGVDNLKKGTNSNRIVVLQKK